MYYVVLAAGTSSRMGFDKLSASIDGRSLLDRAAAVLADRDAIAVVPARLHQAASSQFAQVVVNNQPERGMTHSLHCALELVPKDAAFGVLLADMPAMKQATLARTETLLRDDVDVAYPVDPQGKPGHPVIFSARARAIVSALPDGDTLRQARDHVSLLRATWTCRDVSAFLDLDHRADWEAFVDA